MRVVSKVAMALVMTAWLAPPALGQQAGPGQSGTTADREAAAQAVRIEVERLRQELETIKQQYGDRLAALESRLAALEAGRPAQAAAAPAAAQPPVEPPAAPAVGQAPSTALSKIFNPDMAVIGNFLGAAGSNDVAPSPALQMQEAEFSFQAVVDPYARADFFVGVGADGSVSLEEGFLTFTSLPGGLLTKVGQLKAAFGKVNQMHAHTLPWTDHPLLTTNLVGGDEGIDAAGISVSRLVPNPWFFLEATGEVYGTDSGVFSAPTRGDLSYVGRVRGYRDIGDSSNIDLGTSFAFGHNEAGSDASTRLIGIDATFRYRPLRRALYHRFLARTELVWSRRSELAGEPQSFGTYVSAEYQLTRRWFAGMRLDYADRATDPSLTDKGGSLLLTFWPSEFSQIRSQYRRTRYAEGTTANEFLFQFLFSIGAHGAHVF
jgi:hypothetical protein